MDERSVLTSLSEDERDAALQRFHLLQPHLEGGALLTQLVRAEGIPLRTARRWVSQYRRHGLAGLVRKAWRDRGSHRFPTKLVHLVEGLALRRPPLSAAAIHRQVVPIAQEHGWLIPSYSTVYSLIHRLDPGLVMLAQKGAKAYNEHFDLLYRREADRPNEIWQADHSPLDLWTLDEAGGVVRPWLTVILDDYSRAVAGYRLLLHEPSTHQTALTLRQAIWRKDDPRWHVCGIPDIFYTDHGADFTSDHMEQVAVDLPMQLIFSFPGVPRGRGRIERFFETLNQLFLCTLPGYCPTGAPRAKASLTLAELEFRLHTFLLDDYHLRRHSETGMAPQERWEASGFLPRMPDSLEQLDLLLLTVPKARRVHQDGIHFQGMRYLDLTLAAYVGETVTIRYDPRDLAELRVFHGDRFLCRAICPELAGTEIGLAEIVRARSERRRQLRGEIKDRASLADMFLRVHQPASPARDVPDRSPEPTVRLKRYHNE